jgi:hypothetical protein
MACKTRAVTCIQCTARGLTIVNSQAQQQQQQQQNRKLLPCVCATAVHADTVIFCDVKCINDALKETFRLLLSRCVIMLQKYSFSSTHTRRQTPLLLMENLHCEPGCAAKNKNMYSKKTPRSFFATRFPPYFKLLSVKTALHYYLMILSYSCV